jgi:methylmalonyl-CoA mutase N-terminal domain/subunit
MGGVLRALEQNFFQREIAEASYRFQREVEEGRRLIVGVNAHTSEDDDQVEILRISPEVERRQRERLNAVRGRRDAAAVQAGLERLSADAATDRNVMPALVECARAYASEGEICDALRAVWGVYRETPVF